MDFKKVNANGMIYLAAEGIRMCPDYMMEMIGRTCPEMLVPFSCVESDDTARCMYRTDTGKSLEEIFAEKGVDEDGIRELMYSLDGLQAMCAELLIDEDHVMLEPGNIFTLKGPGEAKYIFNPFERKNFSNSCRKLAANLMGSYFNGYSIQSEIFRERMIRKTRDSSFNPRNVLSAWDELMEKPGSFDKGGEKSEEDDHKREPAIIAMIKGKLPKKEKAEDETGPIGKAEEGMCLTGICSINTKIPVLREGVTIGRSSLHKKYGLYNSSIGKSHARVYEQDGEVYISDLGSKNGTYLNGRRIEKRKPVKVEKGDIIAFSDEEFILC